MARVLLVEDDARVRRMLRETLLLEGHSVAEATDADRALAEQERAPADLVVTDIVMPGGNGIRLIVALKAKCPELPVFAVSGGGPGIEGAELLRAAGQAGADRVFSKPLDIDELLAAVAEVCGRH
ncbi:MAG: response regulator [Desulfovibrionaceae bacterium]|nr:response regulator [Desulfovibrionaceae bacterium]